MDWLIAYRIASGISLLLCLFTIWHLFRTVTFTNKRKLFWMQLSLLTFIDLVVAAVFLTALTRLSSVWDFEKDFEASRHWGNSTVPPTAVWRSILWSALDFCSCFLELEIALGFGFACRGWANVGGLLRCLGIATPLVSCGFAVLGFCVHFRWGIWAPTVLVSCALALLAYAWGASSLLTSHAVPWAFRRRVLLRGLCYGLNATLVFAPYTILYEVSLRKTGHCTSVPSVCTAFFFFRFMYFLNGAVNVCTYAFWMWRSHHLLMQSDASEASLSVRESVVLDEYFYLSRLEPHDEYLAHARVADAVAHAREIR